VRQGRPRNAKGDAALPNGSVLVGLGVSKIDPQKLITFHVPIWFQFGSNLVPIWFQFGSNLVPIWFQFGSNTFLHVTVTEWSKGMEGVAFSRDKAQHLAPKFRHRDTLGSSCRKLWHMQSQTWR